MPGEDFEYHETVSGYERLQSAIERTLTSLAGRFEDEDFQENLMTSVSRSEDDLLQVDAGPFRIFFRGVYKPDGGGAIQYGYCRAEGEGSLPAPVGRWDMRPSSTLEHRISNERHDVEIIAVLTEILHAIRDSDSGGVVFRGVAVSTGSAEH